MPQLRNHILGGVLSVGLQLYEEVAGVGLGDGEGKAGAGAARETLHVGGRGENLFGEEELAVGLGETRAGGRMVVDDEAAFIHRGQEFAFEFLVEKATEDQHDEAGSEGKPATTERTAHGQFVDSDDTSENEATVGSLRGMAVFQFLAVTQEPRRESGSERDGEEQRGKQRDHHGERESPEEDASDAFEERERNEYDDGRERGGDERAEDFADGGVDGVEARPAGDNFRVDGFDDDDGIVDHEANGGGDASEGHQVETKAGEFHGDQGDEDCHRNNHNSRQGGAPVFQEEIDDNDGEDQAEQDSLPDALHRGAHEEGLVVIIGRLHVGWQVMLEVPEDGG